MSVWQFGAAFKGWQIANGQRERDVEAMSVERLREAGVVGF